ncbi:hypothetical protein HMPREF3193_00421 [Bifidobacterium breve]|nr:hypothetical protein HMPREF1587_01751 [Bifidobacterium breve JCP7499]KWZ86243.1 hypothetical protein HMPREF3193_00421 [Bifidobacterium breve]
MLLYGVPDCIRRRWCSRFCCSAFRYALEWIIGLAQVLPRCVSIQSNRFDL